MDKLIDQNLKGELLTNDHIGLSKLINYLANRPEETATPISTVLNTEHSIKAHQTNTEMPSNQL
jgi:hypothetical protein